MNATLTLQVKAGGRTRRIIRGNLEGAGSNGVVYTEIKGLTSSVFEITAPSVTVYNVLAAWLNDLAE